MPSSLLRVIFDHRRKFRSLPAAWGWFWPLPTGTIAIQRGGMEPICRPGETQDVASSTYLYVLLPAGHNPDRDGLPKDVDTLLAEVPETALGGGRGYEQQQDGRWWFNKTITSRDRLDIAEALADRLREVGYRAVVRTRR